MRSSELARLAQISTDTLRHYERMGVIPVPHRSRNGYREYPPSALERVLTVRRALRVGFKLDEIARIFKTRDSGGAPCRQVRSLVGRKLEEVEQRIEQLTTLRNEMRGLIRRWDAVLQRTPVSERAGLLKLLADKPIDAVTAPLSLTKRKRRKARVL